MLDKLSNRKYQDVPSSSTPDLFRAPASYQDLGKRIQQTDRPLRLRGGADLEAVAIPQEYIDNGLRVLKNAQKHPGDTQQIFMERYNIDIKSFPSSSTRQITLIGKRNSLEYYTSLVNVPRGEVTLSAHYSDRNNHFPHSEIIYHSYREVAMQTGLSASDNPIKKIIDKSVVEKSINNLAANLFEHGATELLVKRSDQAKFLALVGTGAVRAKEYASQQHSNIFRGQLERILIKKTSENTIGSIEYHFGR